MAASKGAPVEKFPGISDWKNIYIISLFSFVDAFQFSFFTTSFWPFAYQLNPSISPNFVGMIMAFSGIGEALSAPLFGYWTNNLGRVNPPLITSLVISMFANLSYFCLNAFPYAGALLLSRFLSGVGSGNRAVYISYTASASTKSDRTKAMALSSGGALVGITAGPSVQMLFTWLGSRGLDLGPTRISMYTAPALLAFLINLSCVLLLTLFLDDRLDNRGKEEDTLSRENVADDTQDDTLSGSEEEASPMIRPDMLAVVICMLTRAGRMLVTANVDSVGSPFSQVMFGFDEKEVLHYNGMAQAAVTVIATGMLGIQAFTNYTQWISERINCIVGMAGMLVFHLITFPYPFLTGHVDCPLDENNQTKWAWCNEDLHPTNVYLYYISYVVIFGIGLPCLNNSLQSIYSLVLGNTRQGTMQGLNQAVGSLSRIGGPVLMSSSFTLFGPIANWTVEITTLALFLSIWLLVYKRMVPASERAPTFDEKISAAAKSIETHAQHSTTSTTTKTGSL